MANRLKYTIEYQINCSPSILYPFLSTSSGLGEWFADKVKHKDNSYTFEWEGSDETAEMIAAEENEYVVFRWDWMSSKEYFEFRIEKSPVTNETILTITDFADKNEMQDQQRLWDSQIQELKYRIGS
ncbi:MAG: ATPase [Chitinophagaceae bacterium]|nr:MAG: activator of HSP90 ATPase 1 family protein [Bacteroidetes bacterium OLB11]MCC6448470.1 ATPase [Chitinophagaceae bacterium]HMN33705.1 START-like domain-containing protein [Chitinophagaceae bacterium]